MSSLFFEMIVSLRKAVIMSFSPVRLNHAVLFVTDLERATDFYTEVLGMEIMAREPRADAAFLRLPRSTNHHDLGLFGIGTTAAPKQRGVVGLYHLAWQVDTIDELAEALVVLRDKGALVGQSSHGATKSLYGHDPDGNEFEIMWMLPRHAWHGYSDAAPVDALDLRAELEKWSGISTAHELCFDPSPTTS